MNILMLNQFDIYTSPGTVRMVELSEQFVQKGHQVTLCYCPHEKRRKSLSLLRDKDPAGVTIIELEEDTTKFPKNIKEVRPIARRADVIHFQKCYPKTALIGLWLGLLEKKPVLYDWDDLELSFVPQWSKSKYMYKLLERYEDWLPSMVDAMAYSTQYVRELAIQRGCSPDWMLHGHVGANIKRFHPTNSGDKIKKQYSPDTPLIVYIGQLEDGSYVDLLLHAVKQVVQKTSKVQFLVVGGGFRLAGLRKLCTELNLDSYIQFTDYVPHNTIPEYVAAADFCIACFEDNELTRCKSPLKIAEYLAAGKPMVASAVGDVPFMVDGAGILVPPGNPENLAEGILHLLGNPNELEQMRIIARQRAETIFNWSVVADRFLETYQRLIDKFKNED